MGRPSQFGEKRARLEWWLNIPRSYSVEDMAKRLVSVFSSMLDYPIGFMVESGKPQHTRTSISVTGGSKLLFQHTEWLLAHIVFGTNPEARAVVLTEYEKAQPGSGLAELFQLLSEYLDTYRVIKLWGELYAGSEPLLFATVADEMPPPTAKLPDGLLCLIHEIEYVTDAQKSLDSVFQEALNRVRGSDYLTVLVTTKWLIQQLVNNQMAQQSGQDGSGEEGEKEAPISDPTARKLATARLAASTPKPLNVTRSVMTALRDDARIESRDLAVQALQTPTDSDSMETVADEGRTEMREVLDDLMGKLSKPVAQPDDELRMSVPGHVVFQDVSADTLTGSIDIGARGRRAVEALRAQFIRVMGRIRTELQDSGTDIDPHALIQRRVGKSSAPVFVGDGRSRGFKALILLDRSGSMRGERTKAVEHACRILQESLNFPFVEFEVWGFQQNVASQTEITRFDRDCFSFENKKFKVNGGTPLHVAVRVATNHLKSFSGRKHLFVLTDGEPSYQEMHTDRVKPMVLVDTEVLIEETKVAVNLARQIGIGVTALVIRDRHSTVDEDDCEAMFGASKSWQLVAESRVGKALVQLVSGSFTRYLRYG